MRLPASVRRVTDPLLQDIRVPIVGGVNRGMWWSLISSGSGYASGTRASDQMQLLSALLHPGDVMWDIGAHHGYVTLSASRKVGTGGAVHAFEPSAMNRGVLERHVRWNSLRNVTVHGCALSNFEGTTTFGGSGTSKMFALGGGCEHVAVRTGSSMVQDHGAAPPTFLKIDVEGAEGAAVQGLMPILPRNARLFIAMHSADADAACTRTLGDAGWHCIPSRALVECRTGTWRSDPDLFCIGPEHGRAADDMRNLDRAKF